MKKVTKQLNSDCSVGEWVFQFPVTRHVFTEFEIDFCVQGFLTLKEACRRKRICPNVVLEKLADVLQESNAKEKLPQKPTAERS